MIEVIVQNKDEAIAAEKLGLDRLELVSAMKEDGLTPSYGTMKEVIKSVSIPTQVMIRPHNYGYNYSVNEVIAIQEDIRALLDIGCNTIVFGALTEEGEINQSILEKIISISSDLDITFHRAFDETSSIIKAYKTLTQYKKNVKRILTSGGANTCEDGMKELKDLIQLSHEIKGPTVMPGTGLTKDNIKMIHNELRAEEYHFGKYVREDNLYRNPFDVNIVDYIKTELS